MLEQSALRIGEQLWLAGRIPVERLSNLQLAAAFRNIENGLRPDDVARSADVAALEMRLHHPVYSDEDIDVTREAILATTERLGPTARVARPLGTGRSSGPDGGRHEVEQAALADAFNAPIALPRGPQWELLRLAEHVVALDALRRRSEQVAGYTTPGRAFDDASRAAGFFIVHQRVPSLDEEPPRLVIAPDLDRTSRPGPALPRPPDDAPAGGNHRCDEPATPADDPSDPEVKRPEPRPDPPDVPGEL
jgi:hypothetical protein